MEGGVVPPHVLEVAVAPHALGQTQLAVASAVHTRIQPDLPTRRTSVLIEPPVNADSDDIANKATLGYAHASAALAAYDRTPEQGLGD